MATIGLDTGVAAKKMEEQDILDMQLVQKISRGTARQQYYARYPERGVSYDSTVAQTGAGNSNN